MPSAFRAVAPAVNGPGEDAFPGAAFAADENRCVAGGDLPGEVERPLHGGVAAFEAHISARLADDFLQSGDLLLERAQSRNAIDDELYLRGREGFGQVIGSPAFHGFDGVIDRAVGGDDDDAHPRALLSNCGMRSIPQIGPEAQIDKREIEGLLRRLGDGIAGVADGRHGMSVGFQADRQGFADVDLVIDDENIERLRIVLLCHG